jgi:ABC-type transporter MlaC component
MVSVLALGLSFAGPGMVRAEQVASAEIGEAKGFVATLADEALVIMDGATPVSGGENGDLRTLLSEGISFPVMGQRVVGDAWSGMSLQDRQEFTELFRAYMLNYFIGLLDDSDADTIEVLQANPHAAGEIVVHSKAYRDGSALADVDWIVRQVEGRFQVVDIVLSDISLVRTYGSEFGSLISFRGMDGLMTALRIKVQSH